MTMYVVTRKIYRDDRFMNGNADAIVSNELEAVEKCFEVARETYGDLMNDWFNEPTDNDGDISPQEPLIVHGKFPIVVSVRPNLTWRIEFTYEEVQIDNLFD